MNKQELVSVMAKKCGFSRAETEKAVAAFVDCVKEGVKDEGKVTIVGFGTFEARQRAPREGRNPQTGEIIKVPATVAPVFKPGKAFKDLLN